MVLPLIIGGLAAVGLTYVTISVVSTLAFWLAVLVGVGASVFVFHRLLDSQALPLTGVETLNNLVYAGFASVIGFLTFKILQAVFVLAGVAVAVVAGLVIAAGFLFGFSSLTAFLRAVVLR